MINKATLAGGCFWCIETLFIDLKGVLSVRSGYTGGTIKNPSYREINTGMTGHAEAIQIKYDSDIINFRDLLEIFFTVHDPTTMDRQGNDVGTQYRSAVFYHNDDQKRIAEEVIKEFNMNKIWKNPILTELAEFDEFYEAEEYHQNYYNRNSEVMYCKMVIEPKVIKFRNKFQDKLKKID